MDQVLATVETILAQFPYIRYERTVDSISVPIQPGAEFEAGIDTYADKIEVYFSGWHERFQPEDSDSAIRCLLFGLSHECRLRVCRRGTKEYRWQLQYRNGDQWRDDSEVGLIFVPFWRRKETAFMRNSLIPDVDTALKTIGINA